MNVAIVAKYRETCFCSGNEESTSIQITLLVDILQRFFVLRLDNIFLQD
jgi:hypothetical protein